MRTFLITMFFAICVNTLSTQMPESLKVKEYTLSNGLTVWLNEDHTQPKIFGAVVVKAGSKDSPNTGIAHYFEHIMFKGTDKIGTTDYAAEKIILDSITQKYDQLAATKDKKLASDIQNQINELSIKAADYAIPNEFDRLISKYGGSQLNAGTSYDMTVYFNEFSPQYIEQWAMINSERLINPVFRLFQNELETVYEEKNMYSDFMGALAMEKVMERYFYPHPYAYPIIGSTEYLKNPRISQMQQFFEEYYVASNMGLILSGDFKSEDILPILEKNFSHIRKGEIPKKEITSVPAFNGRETFKIKFPIPVVKIMALGFRGVPANHKDKVALNIAIRLLNNDNGTGYLDQLSVNRKVMAAFSFNESLNEAGILGVAVIPKLIFQTYGSAEKLVWREIDRVKNGDFSEEIFQSLKLEQKRNFESSLEEIKTRANVMMTLYSQGKSWNDYLEEVKSIDELTKEDVMEAAKKYLADNYLYISKKTGNYPKNALPKPGFKPITPKNAEAVSEFAKEMESLPIHNVPPRFIDFNKEADISQPTPLVTVYATPNPVNDIFTLNISYGIGKLEKPILAHLASYLHFLGTVSMPFNVFREKLQILGSTLTFEADEKKFTVQISGFDKKFKETIELVGDFLLHVKADEKQIKQVIDAEKIADKAFFKSSDEVAAALFEKIRFGNKSRFLTKLSLSEVKKLKGEDLLNVFEEVKKTECEIHYCGQLSLEEINKYIGENLKIDRIDKPASLYSRELLSYDKPLIYFFNDPKVSQSIVYSYVKGDAVKDDFTRNTAKLFTGYFGGDMSSLMFQEIREFRSFAYRVRANFYYPPAILEDKPGYFMSMLSTQSDKTLDALGVLDSLIKNMPSKPERINNNRQSLLNEVNNSYPSFRKISLRISEWKKEGYHDDPNKLLVKNIQHIHMPQIEDFYKKYIQKRPIIYMIVGDKKKIDMKALASYGEIVEVKKKDIYR